jgi:SNF2 family DNA or RNA helicase
MSATRTFRGFTPAEFQLEDMDHLVGRDWSANWSEMGCYKTSTVLWLIEQWAERLGVENPRVLIITTRSGKGTYFKHVPLQLPDFEVFNLQATSCKLVLEGHEFPVGVPETVKHPSVFVAHYNVFSRRKKKKKEAEPEPEPESPEDILESLFDEVLQDDKAKSKPAPKVPLIDELLKIHWDIVILDEAHRIKGRSTGWTREIKKIKATVKHVMTGTGFINNPAEIFSLLNFINKSEFSSYWRFREKYCAEDVINGFRKIVGINPEEEENFKKLVREVGPRRTKREVFKNLPEPIYTPYEVELNPIQRKMYDDIRDQLYALDQEGAPIYAPNVLAALQRLRQVCVATPHVMKDYYDPVREKRVQEIKLYEPSSKLDALMDIMEGLEWDDERRDQVVVFSNFKDPIELAKVRFENAGISYLEMTTKDNDRTRYEKWALEFPRKKHQVFICTLQLGSESISLTSASTCVFLDRSWSPKDNDQGVSRVWRPGQEEVANIININAKGTVDGRILATNERKTGWFRAIFG